MIQEIVVPTSVHCVVGGQITAFLRAQILDLPGQSLSFTFISCILNIEVVWVQYVAHHYPLCH